MPSGEWIIVLLLGIGVCMGSHPSDPLVQSQPASEKVSKLERESTVSHYGLPVAFQTLAEVHHNRSKRSSVARHPARSTNGSHSNDDEHIGVHVVSWRWDEVGIYVTITGFVVLSGLAKVGFHHLHVISSRVPESCLLVIVGLAMGGIIKIILEAAYSLYDKAFFDNLPTILVMAVVGTAFNFLLIGFLLYLVFTIGAMGKIRGPFGGDDPVEAKALMAMFSGNYELGIVEVLVFASLISAVDPVAVLAIFQEVGVNPDLYFLLFGESLLNDGVAVVLYNMMNTMAEIEAAGEVITLGQIGLGLASFVTVACGGLLIGIIMGVLTALITRTTSEVRVVEPLALFGMGYLAYVTAELFHWSGIISLIGCGIVQAHYAFKNISKKSYTTVKYFIKMLSATSDCIIFLFLGIALVEGPHYWHTGFVVWTISFTLICRFVGVYGLTFLANRRRIRKVNLQEQFIMAYGGLRGAVGFSLVEMINKEVIPPKQMFVTTTLAVVMFTIFIQGGTIKFLVNLLEIDKASDDQKKISEEVNDNVMEHLMAGIEIISGRRGSQYLGQLLERFDEKYLKRWLCRQWESDLQRLFEELAYTDHLCNLYGPSVVLESGVPGNSLLRHTDEDMDINGDPMMLPTVMGSRRASFSPYPPHGGNFYDDTYQRGADMPEGDQMETRLVNGGQPQHKIVRTRTISGSSGFFRSDGSRMSGRISRIDSESSHRGSRNNSRLEVDTLRSAMRKNSFNKIHQKYNRNLIHDDEQEMESHLQKRHANARRLSTLAMMNPSISGTHESHVDSHGFLSPDSEHSNLLPTIGLRSRNTSIGSNSFNDGPSNRVPGRAREAMMQNRMRSISMSSDRSALGVVDDPKPRSSHISHQGLDRTSSARGVLGAPGLASHQPNVMGAIAAPETNPSSVPPPPLPSRGNLARSSSVPTRPSMGQLTMPRGHTELSSVVEESEDKAKSPKNTVGLPVKENIKNTKL
ncbi:hypothetical protein TCAL_08230 [Tigriopus californicus]|uniref:Sodium/hydrogen exchanger n=1 Tax=Tigriopus californicus TaxID=6832 RepID=A0A553NCG8_TIGCA|nr:hypothetical protein TCAL_08230 [Tigriopus californicus]